MRRLVELYVLDVFTAGETVDGELPPDNLDYIGAKAIGKLRCRLARCKARCVENGTLDELVGFEAVACLLDE